MNSPLPTPDCGATGCPLPAAARPVTQSGLAYLGCGCGALRLPPSQLRRAAVEADTAAGGPIMDALFMLRLRWLQRSLPQLGAPQSRILDAGCGDGQFLAFLARRGHRHVHGVEPEAARRGNALARGLAVSTDLAELGAARFDVVFLWHVLEHVAQPFGLLRQLWTRLEPGGALVVSVPNHDSWQARWFGRFASYLDYGRHLWYWDPRWLEQVRRELPQARLAVVGGRNLEYEIFGWVDSIVGQLAGEPNYVHSRLKKGTGGIAGRLAAAALAALALPPAAALALLVTPARAATFTFALWRDASGPGPIKYGEAGR